MNRHTPDPNSHRKKRALGAVCAASLLLGLLPARLDAAGAAATSAAGEPGLGTALSFSLHEGTSVRLEGGTLLAGGEPRTRRGRATLLTASKDSTINLPTCWSAKLAATEPVVIWREHPATDLANRTETTSPLGAASGELAFGRAVPEPRPVGQIWFTGEGADGLFLLSGSQDPSPIPEAEIVWAAAAIALMVLWKERQRLVALIQSAGRKRRPQPVPRGAPPDHE